MQNQFAGDIGDFSKFGLLRYLCQPHTATGLRLALVWCLAQNSGNNDGRHIDYLSDRTSVDYRSCDPELFDALGRIAYAPERHIGLFEAEALLPPDALWIRESLTFPGLATQRRAARKAWLDASLRATASADFVFFDPDNGLEIASVPPGNRDDHRFMFYSEIEPFVSRGQSIGVYQHLSRTGKAEDQIRRRADEIGERLGVKDVLCLRWRRYSSRLYFILPNRKSARAVKDCVGALMASPWREHFDEVPV